MKINNYMVLTGQINATENIKAASWWPKMRNRFSVQLYSARGLLAVEVVVFCSKIDIESSYMQIEENAAEERCPEGR